MVFRPKADQPRAGKTIPFNRSGTLSLGTYPTITRFLPCSLAS
jgi:hypothetical protein